MHISTSYLKQELSTWQEKLQNRLSTRVHTVLNEIVEDLPQTEEMGLFGLIVRIILKADKDPAHCISDLLILVNPENSDDLLEKWTISDSAAFLRDYLQKDRVIYAIDRREKKSIEHLNDEK